MAGQRAGTSSLARLVALLVCAGCVVLIALRTREPSVPSSTGDCTTLARTEIERDETAAGRLTAEQAIIRRRRIAARCL